MLTSLKNTCLVFLCVLAFPLLAQSSLALAEVSSATATVASVPAADLPFVAASFPGGAKQLYRQLNKQTKYPELAREYAVEGTVVVRLQLGASGEIIGQQVIKGIGFGCDEAAIAALNSLPDWNPARKGGYEVASFIYVPLRFKLR